jgi:hypothetical protein
MSPQPGLLGPLLSRVNVRCRIPCTFPSRSPLTVSNQTLSVGLAFLILDAGNSGLPLFSLRVSRSVGVRVVATSYGPWPGSMEHRQHGTFTQPS